ncbi:S24 family peptidase [Sulfurimonas sp.]|uniref:S24 family peptidase n=1 Tax=Sulfurimonas sp. TaxID=2022749 RepID=UPI0025EE55BC|nr:S24 family peptidase [Sulfurimonas sp.]
MYNYSEIIEKLKDILSRELNDIKTQDKDVAVALDIDYSNFRKQKARNSPHYLEIMQFLAKRNISINWFFFSQLPESLVESTSNYIILKYQKSVITSAGAGAINDELNTTPLVIDKQLLDHINSSYKYTEVLQVFGESMEPDIKDGSLVFVDKSQVEINSTGLYVINTPDGLHIKSIKIKDNKYYMRSINKLYEDVKLEEFDVIGQVKGVYIKF